MGKVGLVVFFFFLEGTFFFNGSLNTGCQLNVFFGRSVLNTKDETSQGNKMISKAP